MERRMKKDLAINIDEKEGHLYLGDKKADIRLVMLRPNEIMEFAEFAGTNADDILIWVGKTIGKSFIGKLFTSKDWDKVKLSDKKEVVKSVLDTLMLLGYGGLTSTFKKDHIIINVYDSLATNEKENIMAKNLCLLYLGIFTGIFDLIGIDVDGNEVECVLTGGDKCSFKLDLLVGEIDNNLVDAEISDEAVADFLSSL